MKSRVHLKSVEVVAYQVYMIFVRFVAFTVFSSSTRISHIASHRHGRAAATARAATIRACRRRYFLVPHTLSRPPSIIARITATSFPFSADIYIFSMFLLHTHTHSIFTHWKASKTKVNNRYTYNMSPQ